MCKGFLIKKLKKSDYEKITFTHIQIKYFLNEMTKKII
jgi:hypothetical protein